MRLQEGTADDPHSHGRHGPHIFHIVGGWNGQT
jgi:hypothetical protein